MQEEANRSTTAASVPTEHHEAPLAEYESFDRPAFFLNKTEVKLLGIAGVGFFLDAYDLFIINPVATMLQYRLYGGHQLPTNLEGFVKAGANIGSVIGQFAFGYAADALGRKAVYGKELMLIILATILTLTTPTGSLSPDGALIYLGIFRILLGGWGSLAGSLVTIIVLACYKHVMEGEGKTSKVDGVWRIVVGVSLIPAFGTLYQRLTLPESTRFKASRKLHTGGSSAEEQDAIETIKRAQLGEELKLGNLRSEDIEKAEAIQVERRQKEKEGEKDGEISVTSASGSGDGDETSASAEVLVQKKAHLSDFIKYFSEWRHAKMLIGTCGCWFLLDIAFYGINLNQNVVLQQIGYDGSSGSPWHRLFKVSTGNIIVTALGFVPGYWASVLTIEILGRKKIQMGGFLMAALFLGILAGKFHELSKAAFIVNFALLQFFFNFGANTTTYCYPAEVFPTRYKAFAHGISAAAGKAGAIISALAFNTLSKDIGTPAVLWIFFGCCIAGAALTLLLPEVKGRDPDLILAEEIRVEREKAASLGE